MNILYPLKNASNYSKRIIYESLPLIPLICKTLSKTKLVSLKGKSLEDVFPMQLASPYSIKKLLTFDLSHFSVDMNTMVKYPIHTMVAFGTIQMLGKKSIIWITDEMSKWLAKLGEVEVK